MLTERFILIHASNGVLANTYSFHCNRPLGISHVDVSKVNAVSND